MSSGRDRPWDVHVFEKGAQTAMTTTDLMNLLVGLCIVSLVLGIAKKMTKVIIIAVLVLLVLTVLNGGVPIDLPWW